MNSTDRISVLIHFRCCNHRLGGLYTKHVSLTELAARSPRSRARRSGVWSEPASFSLCPHIAGGVRELCGISLIRALIPFTRVPPSSPNHLPEAPPHNTIILGIWSQHTNWGRWDADIQQRAESMREFMKGSAETF